MSDGQPDSREWHLEKSVSIGHIVTTLVVAVGVVLYLSDIERRIDGTVIEQQHLKSDVVRIEQAQRNQSDWIARSINEMRAEQKSDNQRIEDKLDKLIERELGKRDP